MVRELGIGHRESRRAVEIGSMLGNNPEVEQTALDAGLDDNQSVLLAAAREPTLEVQLVAIRREEEKRETARASRESSRNTARTEA